MTTFSYANPLEPTIDKDPLAVVDYGWKWTKWLAGDTISTFLVTVEAPLTMDPATRNGDIITVVIHGGTVGRRYKVTCKVVTVAGRTDERSMFLNVVAR